MGNSRRYSMNKEIVFIITEDVIEDCLSESLEK